VVRNGLAEITTLAKNVEYSLEPQAPVFTNYSVGKRWLMRSGSLLEVDFRSARLQRSIDALSTMMDDGDIPIAKPLPRSEHTKSWPLPWPSRERSRGRAGFARVPAPARQTFTYHEDLGRAFCLP